MQLNAYETRLLMCEPKWSGAPSGSKVRYLFHIEEAQKQADAKLPSPSGPRPVWLPVVNHPNHAFDFETVVFAEDPDSSDLPDAEAILLQDVLQDEAAADSESPDAENAGPRIHWQPPVRDSNRKHIQPN